MRTTLNIRDDVMALLKEEARTRNQSLTAVVNEILKNGLKPTPGGGAAFRQEVHRLGERPGINFHKSLDLAAEMETDYTLHKLELGK
jgi:hypothetical protein